MRFVMLIHNDFESLEEWDSLTPDEQKADMDRHIAWFGEHAAAGHIVGGEQLQRPHRTRTLRRRDRSLVASDGPFIESKEQIGGFVVLEVPDVAAAESIAHTWPGFPRWCAGVELREVGAS